MLFSPEAPIALKREEQESRNHEMPRTRIYGALSFLVVLRNGVAFIGPVLFAGDASLSRSQGLIGRRCGASSDLRVGFSVCASPVVRTPRGGGVSMMAKKRRRRKADKATPEAPPKAVVVPEAKTAAPKAMEVGGGPLEGEKEEEVGEEEYVNVGAVVMPPLPSELGMETVQLSQDLAGEDMMSAAAFQPKPDVADIEMVDGGMGGGGAGLIDEPSANKDSKYKFDLDIELPMESESREGSQRSMLSSTPMSPDGVMPLPDFRDLAKKPRKKERLEQATQADDAQKVERGNMAAFTSLLELDPEADSEEGLFTTESYDALSSILGEGKPFVGIANSYLQSGHTVLLALVLLCGFVELPGFPLTSLPYEVRQFLKTGLLVVYVINAAIAYLSYLEANRVGQPAGFWAVKGFFLGGLAFNELSQIEPSKVDVPKGARQRRD